jgi:hypothetical protein
MIDQVDDDHRRVFYQNINERLLMDYDQSTKSFEEFLETEVFYEQILHDKKYMMLIDLLGKMLTICPYRRIKPDEALHHQFFSNVKVVKK